jgi:hypothetical protein
MLRKIFLILFLLLYSNLTGQETSINTLEDLIVYYSDKGYSLCNPEINPPLVISVNYFLSKYPNTNIEGVVPLIMGNNPVYWFIFINLSPERNMPNILVAAYHKFNDIEYIFYKINENMATVEERLFIINGQNERFKLFY